jgi:Asp-tRNA(Asn)/Glu-tRNA(Gln) amidotransferase A subunit family amidase
MLLGQRLRGNHCPAHDRQALLAAHLVAVAEEAGKEPSETTGRRPGKTHELLNRDKRMYNKPIPDRTPFSDALTRFYEGSDSPRAYLERCIERIEAEEGRIKAFCHFDLDAARQAADESTKRYTAGQPLSPIDGMPIGVKDIIDTAGMPTQMNNEIYRGHVPRCDAACVRATREGGGVIVGKTVTTEFAISRSGPTTNPHDLNRTPGGSSSGSAAGVAAGMIAAGFGTQTQGSILRPASFCGVVGYKPTLGALSTDGVHPLSRSHDHLGALADSVDDAWALCRWVSEQAVGQDQWGLSGPVGAPVPALPLTRVAVLRTNGFGELNEDCLQAFENLLGRLRSEGVSLTEPDEDPALKAVIERLELVPENSLDMVSYDMRWPFLGYLENHAGDLGPRIHELMKRARTLTRENYRELLMLRAELRERIAALRDMYDAFVLPAASEIAPEGFGFTGSRTMLVYWTFVGLPAYSVPVMSVRGLPLGVQIAGLHGEDYRLTRHAKWAALSLVASADQ